MTSSYTNLQNPFAHTFEVSFVLRFSQCRLVHDISTDVVLPEQRRNL